jgi:hypothetical protein
MPHLNSPIPTAKGAPEQTMAKLFLKLVLLLPPVFTILIFMSLGVYSSSESFVSIVGRDDARNIQKFALATFPHRSVREIEIPYNWSTYAEVSPNAQFGAFERSDDVNILNFSSQAVVANYACDNLETFNWSSDSRRMMFFCRSSNSIEGELIIFDIETSATICTSAGQANIWSPNGYFAAAFIENNLTVYDICTAQQRTFTNVIHPSWSPDSRHIAFFSREQEQLVIFDAISQRVHFIPSLTWSYPEEELLGSPDGQWLAYYYHPSDLESLLYTFHLPSQTVYFIGDMQNHDYLLTWSPDSQWLITQGWPGLTFHRPDASSSQTLFSFGAWIRDWNSSGQAFLIIRESDARISPRPLPQLYLGHFDAAGNTISVERIAANVSDAQWSPNGRWLIGSQLISAMPRIRHLVWIDPERRMILPISFDTALDVIRFQFHTP